MNKQLESTEYTLKNYKPDDPSAMETFTSISEASVPSAQTTPKIMSNATIISAGDSTTISSVKVISSKLVSPNASAIISDLTSTTEMSTVQCTSSLTSGVVASESSPDPMTTAARDVNMLRMTLSPEERVASNDATASKILSSADPIALEGVAKGRSPSSNEGPVALEDAAKSKSPHSKEDPVASEGAAGNNQPPSSMTDSDTKQLLVLPSGLVRHLRYFNPLQSIKFQIEDKTVSVVPESCSSVATGNNDGIKLILPAGSLPDDFTTGLTNPIAFQILSSRRGENPVLSMKCLNAIRKPIPC